jgi:hypothetical protein
VLESALGDEAAFGVELGRWLAKRGERVALTCTALTLQLQCEPKWNACEYSIPQPVWPKSSSA